ncbi:MAG: hypothetical protein KIS78_35540 [Labilithrix sp.]|nr:hypothetical protein [Labilithrix sp.]
MKLTEVASFDVVHGGLSWPWIAFAAGGGRFAFAASRDRVVSRALEGDGVADGPSFALPADLHLPDEPSRPEAGRDARAGVHAFSIDDRGRRLAVVGGVASGGALVTLEPDRELRRSAVDALAGPGFVAQAVAFERGGARLWISAESERETAVLLVDAESHAPIGVVKSPAFPQPATHELHLHPREAAALLLAACGQDGTFARVVRCVDDRLVASWTSLDGGAVSAGMVGFSADGARLYLAEADELRVHVWPGLKELSSVELEDDFVSSYSGAVFDGHVLVDGQDAETQEDAVMVFDPTATSGALASPPVPRGMWAGRLGADLLVTVEAKGEPARGRVIRLGPVSGRP